MWKKKKPTVYKFTYEGEHGIRVISTAAENRDEAQALCERRLEEQFGPQPRQVFRAVRNEQGQVVLDGNGEPQLSNEYDIVFESPRNKGGEPDDSLLQKNYKLIDVEEF